MSEITLTARGAILQDITLALILGIIVTEVLWLVNSPKRHLYAVPLLILMIHMLVYYGYVIAYRLDAVEITYAAYVFTAWSALLRFHAVATWLTVEGFRLYRTVRSRGMHGTNH